MNTTHIKKHYHREYRPIHALYAPIYMYWFRNSLRARDVMYLYDTNPGMPPVSFLRFSKRQILQQIAPSYIPKTLFKKADNTLSIQEIEDFIEHCGGFPVIAKPDSGERGQDVLLAKNISELKIYLKENHAHDLLIQEYISHEIELGVMYYRHPGEQSGHISGITIKEFPQVTGDGIHTLRELVQQHERFYHYETVFEKLHKEGFDRIVAKETTIQLNHIGNHSKGTKFINGNHFINDQLIKVFDRIAAHIDGFYYGRFDLKVTSREDLYAGENIKILEVNGIQSEPAHIYDPRTSLREGYSELFKHRIIMYKISKQNRQVLDQKVNISFLEHLCDEIRYQKKKKTLLST